MIANYCNINNSFFNLNNYLDSQQYREIPGSIGLSTRMATLISWDFFLCFSSKLK